EKTPRPRHRGPKPCFSAVPGVYMAARDLRLPGILGRHQYLILIPQNPAQFDDLPPTARPRDLGNNILGIVIGAHPVKHERHKRSELRASFFEKGDDWATKQCLNPDKFIRLFKQKLHTEVLSVNLSGAGAGSIDTSIRAIVNAVHNYNK